jgi:hypothetical protein
VSPELVTIREILSRCFVIVKNSGVAVVLAVVLAVDNTTCTMFHDWVVKLEQVAIKICLPGIDNAQQSPALAIPSFHGRYVTYDTCCLLWQGLNSKREHDSKISCCRQCVVEQFETPSLKIRDLQCSPHTSSLNNSMSSMWMIFWWKNTHGCAYRQGMTKGCTSFVLGVGMCSGDVTYGALKKVLGDMIRIGRYGDCARCWNPRFSMASAQTTSLLLSWLA